MDTQNAAEMLAMFRPILAKVEFGNEMLSLVQKLIEERDQLLQSQEHLRSLGRLAEKTVYEADQMAAQIKKEAEAEALEKVQKIVEETRARALADAETELQGTLKQRREKLLSQVREQSEGLHRQMLTHAEESKRRLESLQTTLEESLSNVLVTLPGHACEPESEKNAGVAEEAMGAEKTDSGPEATIEGSAEPGAEDPPELVEIDILPPRDKQAMEGIKRYLEMQDEVGAADICHLTDKTLIRVRLLRQMDVAERLSGLSEVEDVKTVKDSGQHKLEVILSVHGELEREREALNVRANKMAARIGHSRFSPR